MSRVCLIQCSMVASLPPQRLLCTLLLTLQFTATVVPEHFLAVFDFSELELFLGGCPEIDVEDWRSNTEVTSREFALPDNVEWFWEIVGSWSHEQRVSRTAMRRSGRASRQ